MPRSSKLGADIVALADSTIVGCTVNCGVPLYANAVHLVRDSSEIAKDAQTATLAQARLVIESKDTSLNGLGVCIERGLEDVFRPAVLRSAMTR